jgi:threonine/homoserine/homoserine lactone efflux protein
MIDWIALSTYTFVMSITPGPNNIMLLASGARFGIRRTLPHLAGVSAGFTAQTVAVCAGLGVVADWLPGVQAWLTWAGVAFMAWLSVRLLRSGPPAEAAATAAAQPLSFIEAVLFQAINPKAWVIALTTASVFMPKSGDLVLALAGITLVLIAINLPCIGAWAVGGSALRGWLADERRRLAFNVTMAVLLAATALGRLRS